MGVDPSRVPNCLSQFKFTPLFINELGWDFYNGQPLRLLVEGKTYTLNALAEKHGLVVYKCQPDSLGEIPNIAIRRQIEQEVTKYIYEHLIVYTDAAQTKQIWQWVRRSTQRIVFREYLFCNYQFGGGLIQKVGAISFSLDEEIALTLVEVTSRVRQAFDQKGDTNLFIPDSLSESGKNIPKDLLNTFAERILKEVIPYLISCTYRINSEKANKEHKIVTGDEG